MPPPIRFGPFALDPANAMLTRDGRRIELAPKAFDLLVLLARQPGQLVTKDRILDEVWGRRFVSESVVKTVVSALRAALEDDPRAPRWLETVSRRGYRFIGALEGPAAAPEVAAAPELLAPVVAAPATLIGRDGALTQLRRAWQGAARGERRLVFVAGEPGVGKTTLLTELAREFDGGVVALGQCVEQYGAAEPYLPVLEALNTLCGDDPKVLPLVRQVAPTWLVQMPWHLDEADRAALQREVAGASQDRMLREMGVLLEHLAARTRLLLVLEDLHWADVATVRLLDHLARRRGPARLLVLASFRPAEVIADEHPLGNLRRELRLHRLCDEVHLEGFTRLQVADFVRARLDGAPVDPGMVESLERHTDGLPLFLASVLDELLDQALVRRGDDGTWRFAAGMPPHLPLPDNLLGLVEKQMQRLDAELCRWLSAAALGALEFDHLSLAQALDVPADTLRERFDALVQRRLWLRGCEPRTLPDGRLAMRYTFVHALFRHAFAHRLGAAARIELHRRLGQALEEQQRERAVDIAADLARHAERGADPARAGRWYAVAAQQATQRIAPLEALALAERGLALLAPLPEGPARAAELGLLTLRIGAIAVTRGYSHPSATPDIERARTLIEAQPLTAALAPLWHAIWWALNNGGHWAASEQHAQRFLALAERSDSLAAQAAAHNIRGLCAVFANDFATGIDELQRSLALQRDWSPADRQLPFVQDLRLEALSLLTVALQARGRFADAAAARAEIEACITAGTDPLSEAMGLWFMACSHQLRRDPAAMQTLCRRALQLMSTRSALPGAGPHHLSLGWARVMAGDLADGLAEVGLGITHYEQQGSVMGMSWQRASQAEAHLAAGDPAGARRHLDNALALAAQTRFCILQAYVLRLEGSVRWATGAGLEAAVAAWEEAIALAHAQGALQLELLAVTALAEALAAAGQGAAARTRVRAMLGRLGPDAEGPALQRARALLDAPGTD
ncbi:MAG: AAA family ATPase [Piscinibacter sp.]|nr:AAA family ATPase [Piscinibacter sp.]